MCSLLKIVKPDNQSYTENPTVPFILKTKYI